jgi:uncharacterized protein
MAPQPPFPPFDGMTAPQKVQAVEDIWGTCDPDRVALAYTHDTVCRYRARLVTGRDEILAMLREKWSRELDYAVRKELWGFRGNRMAVRFQYEWHDPAGQWWRSYGTELFEFAEDGLTRLQESSINDTRIAATDRRIFGPRPATERGTPLPVV